MSGGKVHETLRERHPNVSQGVTAGIMRNHPNPTRPCRSLQNRERTRCMSRPGPRRPPHGIGNHVAAFIDITAISNLRKTQSSRYNPNNLPSLFGLRHHVDRTRGHSTIVVENAVIKRSKKVEWHNRHHGRIRHQGTPWPIVPLRHSPHRRPVGVETQRSYQAKQVRWS